MSQLQTNDSIALNNDSIALTNDSIALVWEGLCYEDSPNFLEQVITKCRLSNKKRRQILTDLNGCLKFGELTALMGPSGAGKSTLLNCLTQGESYDGTDGRIAVAKAEMRSVFITQNEKDHLLLNLTVFESLYYASEMKNPYTTTRSQHKEIVKQLLDDLDLEKVENVMIGRCSGGQKKRIAIALELTVITKPNFVFLDEPTSGLDSTSGLNVRYLFVSQNLISYWVSFEGDTSTQNFGTTTEHCRGHSYTSAQF